MLFKDFEIETKQLTQSQEELVEKFTAAFYDAQNINHCEDDLLNTFDEQCFDNIETYENSEFLLDFLMSKSEEVGSVISSGPDTNTNFDYQEFSQNFDHQLHSEYVDLSEISTSGQDDFNDIDLSEFDSYEGLSGTETGEIGDCEDEWTNDLDQAVLIKNDPDFSNFLRSREADSLHYFDQTAHNNSSMGHLVGIKNINNNLELHTESHNQIVLHQNEALLRDDPVLSSSSNFFPIIKLHDNENLESDDGDESIPAHLQCKWFDCYAIYDSQNSLVRHIEKTHVELKRGEEFTCFWLNCPRKTKPFNARYKLLIHMRVHSGEKPNKCPFKDCTKAFSRLENLKIHQRSHTGERPYVCQFSMCTKSFSNSSDRAKHQRTHFDTKPYACQVAGCPKKYTDPSSLRKHVKNHSFEEQMQLKRKNDTLNPNISYPSLQHSLTAVKKLYNNTDHTYTSTLVPVINCSQNTFSFNVKRDLKNKISEKQQRKLNFS